MIQLLGLLTLKSLVSMNVNHLKSWLIWTKLKKFSSSAKPF